MGGNRRLMIGAVLLLVVGTVGVFVAKRMTGPAPQEVPKFSRVIAKEDIPPHFIITKEMVTEEKDLTKEPGDVATTVAEVADKVSLKKIDKGTAIPKDAFSPQAIGVSKLKSTVPEGKRAMAIMVDTETGVGGLVVEGDHVDVIVFYRSGEDTVSRVVVQNITVLATELTVTPPPPMPPAGSPEAAKAAQAPPTPPKKLMRIVLAVTADEAQQLVAAKDKGGDLIPILRNPKSSEVFAQLQETWEHPHKPHVHYGQKVPNTRRKGDPPEVPAGGAPAVPPRGPRPVNVILPPAPEGVDVTVIRGSEREIKTVPR